MLAHCDVKAYSSALLCNMYAFSFMCAYTHYNENLKVHYFFPICPPSLPLLTF